MADRDYADVLLTGLAWDETKVVLRDLARLRLGAKRAQNPVKGMWRGRAARGFTAGTTELDGELETAVGMPAEVDWFALWKANKRLLMGVEVGDGGQRLNVVGMKITDVNLDGGEDGEVKQTVSFVFTDLEPQPGTGVLGL